MACKAPMRQRTAAPCEGVQSTRTSFRPGPPPPCSSVSSKTVVCKSSNVDDALAEANKLLARVARQEPITIDTEYPITEELEYLCDESGCVVIQPAKSTASKKGSPILTKLLRGKDWTLGLDSSLSSGEYSGLVAGAGWNIQLTPAELSDFIESILRIRAVVQNIQSKGEDRVEGKDLLQSSSIKWDKSNVHMEGRPGAEGFSLRFSICTPSKRVVWGSWPEAVVTEVIKALQEELAPAETEVLLPATVRA